MSQTYKNMVFCNLFYSGSSAIAPILLNLLPQYGVPMCRMPGDAHLLTENPQPPPHFTWSHLPPEYMIPLLEKDHVRVVYLHRDLRDVAVTYLDDHVTRNIFTR